MKHKNTLYLDMDDVVADWLQEAYRFLAPFELDETGMIPHHDWLRLREHHHFYRTLPLMAGAKDLVLWATGFANRNNMRLAFLTAIPFKNDMQYVYTDKMKWAHDHFPGIPVFFGPFAENKQHHCVPGDILIDDRTSNCLEWRAAGGYAHQYTTWVDFKEKANLIEAYVLKDIITC